MAPANVLTEWARLTMSSFADAGVTDIVISPGSRSTPFIVAALREKRLRCHSIIDERAAGFFALGHARATGRPAVVLCTSGTAPAHYYPALLEAELAFVPFIVLSADRPTELQSCAAPQTLDQVKLFGDHVRKFFDLGQPDSEDGALRACRRMVGQAVFLATSPTPGPVHLNARARKPLEPSHPSTDEERGLRERVDRLLAAPITRAFAPSRAPQVDAVATVAERLARAERGVIVCGPAAIAQRGARAAVFALAAKTGFPLLAEATSQLRFAEVPPDVFAADAFDVFLRLPDLRQVAPSRRRRPDRPHRPVSDAFFTFAGQPGVERVVIAADGWNDPASNATWMVFGDPAETVAAITERLAAHPAVTATSATSDWLAAFRQANERAWASVDHVLSHEPGEPWSEGVIVQTVVAALPRASHLVLGNSLPVRMIDLYCRHQMANLAVASQRGVSGIDGYLASTGGYADALQEPTTLLLGDVTFLHDLSSLGIAQRAGSRTSVAIVVIQKRRRPHLRTAAARRGERPRTGDHAARDHAALAGYFAPGAVLRCAVCTGERRGGAEGRARGSACEARVHVDRGDRARPRRSAAAAAGGEGAGLSLRGRRQVGVESLSDGPPAMAPFRSPARIVRNGHGSPFALSASAVVLVATLSLVNRAWHPLRAVYYSLTAPPPTELHDFGRSNVFHDGDQELSWETVAAEITWSPARDRDAALAAAPFPVFRPPLRRAALVVPAEDCGASALEVKVSDAHAHTFRFVVWPSVNAAGRCEDDEVFVNESESATVSVARLRSRAAPELVLATSEGAPPAPKLWLSYRFNFILAAVDPLKASHATGGAGDFRLANYTIYSRVMGRAVVSEVLDSSQSLVLMSSEMLRSTNARDVWLDAFAASSEFPYYIVLRSPLAYREPTERTVMHLKGYTVDDRYGQYTSSSYDIGSLRVEYAIELFDRDSIGQMRTMITSILTGERSPSILGEKESAMGRLYYNFPTPFVPKRAAVTDEEQSSFEKLVLEKLRDTGPRITIFMPHDLSDQVWDVIARSPAERVLLIVNLPLFGDLSAARLRTIRDRLQNARPGRQVVQIAVRDPKPPINAPFHLRAYVFGGDRCVLSEASFSTEGMLHSDESLLWATPSVCYQFRQQARDFFGLSSSNPIPPELTASTSFSFARASGAQSDRPHYEYYDVTAAATPTKLVEEEVQRQVAPFLD